MAHTYVVQPSILHLALITAISATATFAILVNSLFHPETGSLVVIAVLVSVIRVLHKRQTHRLRVYQDNWFVDGEGPQKISGSLFTGRWFIVLRFSSSGVVVIGRDSLCDGAYRKLSVLLRARASRMMAV